MSSTPVSAAPQRPPLSRLNSAASSAGGSPNSSRRSSMEIDGVDITAGLAPQPLSDLLETLEGFFAPRIDLMDRRLRQVGGDLRKRAKRIAREDLVRRAKSKEELRGMKIELQKMRVKVAERVDRLQGRWADAKIVRLRDKISFVVGVMNLVGTSLVFALRPEWIPIVYSVQTLYFLPLRVYTYTKRQWHYFLFDFCYASNVLNLIFIWFFPSSRFLFTVCYCASHGPLAFSIATWRNSAVFHSLEKTTSLFIHIYPPLVFMTIRHFTPRAIAERDFPALKGLDHLDAVEAFWLNLGVYLVWQLLYYEFIVLRKAEKVKSGQRINSYSTMASGKGAVANLLAKASEKRREPAFMLLQAVYTIVCTLPAPLLFYKSAKASAIFILALLTLSVWNGANYLVEVTFRRFERELEALRKETEQAVAFAAVVDEGSANASTSPSTSASRRTSRDVSFDESQSVDVEPPSEEKKDI